MLNIEFDNDSKLLLLQCSGKQFHDEIETCKYLKAIFNPSLKKWTISPSRFNEIIDEFQQFGVSISEFHKREIKQYFENIKELKVITDRKNYRYFKPELLNFPPIKTYWK